MKTTLKKLMTAALILAALVAITTRNRADTTIGGGVLGAVNLKSATINIQFAWDRGTDGDLVGYFIYYGTNSGDYSTSVFVGNTTNATLSGFSRGVTYYFAATSTNSAGLESMFSDEINYTVPQ